MLPQSGYSNDLFREFLVTKTAVTPATDSLFAVSEEVTPVDSSSFASKLMKLISYLAKRTRPDLLLAVKFLATRMKTANNCDDLKLTRVYEYLSAPNYPFTLQPSNLRIPAWIDASYAVHADACSHTGTVLYTFDQMYKSSCLVLQSMQN